MKWRVILLNFKLQISRQSFEIISKIIQQLKNIFIERITRVSTFIVLFNRNCLILVLKFQDPIVHSRKVAVSCS